jgi:hypothetical protein
LVVVHAAGDRPDHHLRGMPAAADHNGQLVPAPALAAAGERRLLLQQARVEQAVVGDTEFYYYSLINFIFFNLFLNFVFFCLTI